MLGKVNVADRRRSAQMSARGFGISCLAAAAVFLAGLVAPMPQAFGSVALTHFGIDPGGAPAPPVTPTPVPVSLNGTTGTTNPYPAIPEAVEYDRLIRAQRETGALDTSLLGESIDYYTGETDFVATDVDLPGNNALPVRVGRRYHVTNHAGGVLKGAFGDWDLDIPHVEGVFATNVGWTISNPANDDARCSNFSAPPPAVVTTTVGASTITTTVPASEYSNGFTVVIPGQGRHELLLRANDSPAPTGNHPVITKELWAVSCVQLDGVPLSDGIDEGFVITTPDGITYTFNQGSVRSYAPLVRQADTSQAGVMATVDREEIWLMPTRIEDRFGNWVKFKYEGGNPGEFVTLTNIDSKDDRHITLTPGGGGISTVSDGTRTWQYTYANHLSQVTLPDDSAWHINFGNFDNAAWTYDAPTCTSLPQPLDPGTFTGTIQHPTGALGTFSFQMKRHGRNGAPSTCLTNGVGTPFAPTEPSVYDVMSLTKKQISGPHVPSTLTWTLAYDGCSTTSCNATTTTTVTDPRNYKTLYTFGAQYGTNGSGNEGMLLRKQSGGSGSTYLQDEQYTYYTASGEPYPAVLGTPSQVRGDVSQLSSLRPVQSRTITRDGATYTRTLSNPDAYGFSQKITRTGTDTRTDTISYAHNTTDWVLGSVKSVHSGGPSDPNDVDIAYNAHSQPTQVKRFGRIDKTLEYDDVYGTLLWIENGPTDSDRVTFSDYFLGIPRTIHYADGGSETVDVSALGKITSHKDVMGHVTGYGYDAMGRLHSITPPQPTPTTTYSSTSIDWTTSATGWTRTTITGNAKTVDTYDAFLHPVTTTDSAAGTTVRTVERAFDADGNATFVSYPANPATSTDGTTYTYDGLDRVRVATDNLSYTTNTNYNANERVVYDRNNHATTTRYMAYDEPTTAWPKTVITPGGTPAATWISRDTWGKPLQIQRGSIKRTFHYNVYQQLYTVTEPETGTRTFTYYDNGTVKTVNHNSAVTETRIYDGRDRLKSISYDDGSAGITQGWRHDGLPETSSRGGVSRSYAYDGANLLTGETVTIDGTPYTMGYAYDSNQHVKTLTYPDTTSVDYAPDALGRPSKVGTYAASVVYFANDAIKTFTYGNGITHTLTQDDRLFPKTVVEPGILSATYVYDGNGNPLTISDSVNAAHSRTLTYDSRDRLWTASGPWGSKTFTDDDLDNLTAESGTQGVTVPIDPTTNLATSFNTGTGTQPLTWDTRGRLKQKGTGANAPRYTFDAADLLTGVTQGSNTWAYTYDTLGYRATVSGPSQQVASVYDHSGRLLYEATTTGANPDRIFQSGFEPATPPTSATKYVYLGSHLIAKAEKTGNSTQTIYVHTDALGTPIAQTNASKTIIGTSTYLPYGGLYTSSGIGNETGPAYANQYADDTGLIYMHARDYDPQLRRFISPDPDPVDAGTALNFNRYAYAYNSPFAKYDPSGRCGTDIPDQEDVAGQCGGDASSSSSLPSAGDVLQGIDSAMVAMGPVGVEVSGVERAGVAAAEEVAAAAPAVIEDVEAGIAAFEEAAGIARSSQLGQEGEAAVREVYDIGNKIAFDVAGRTRVPDGTNFALETLSEVKNVGYQGFTSQLRDYVQIAQNNNLTFNLYLRESTRVSAPLQQAIDCGWICRLDIPQ